MTSTPKRCNEMTSSFPNSPLPSNNTFVALDVNAVPKVIKITPQNELKKKWLENITPFLEKASLKIPSESTWKPVYGGRNCNHTEHLKPLVLEMSEVFNIDPDAEW